MQAIEIGNYFRAISKGNDFKVIKNNVAQLGS